MADPRQRTRRHFLQNAVGNILMPLSSLLTGPLIARALGPEGRGAMAAVVVPVSLANLLFTFGLPEALTYFVSRGQLQRARALRIAMGGGLALGLIAAGTLLVLAPGILVNYPQLRTTFIALSFTLPLSIAFAAYRGLAAGLRRFDLILWERASATGLRTGAIVLLVAVGALTASSAAYVTVGTAVLSSFILLRVLRSPLRAGKPTPTARQITTFSLAAGVGTIGSVLVLRLDQTLMAPLAPAEQLGYYAVAVSLAELPIAITAAVRDVVFTVAAETDDLEFAAQASRRTVLLQLIACLVGVLAAPVVLPMLFGAAFRGAVPVTQLLLFGTLASSATAVLGSGLLSAGKPASRSAVMIGGAVLSIPLLVWWVPIWGAMGAAAASVASYVLMAVATVWLFSRSSGIGPLRCVIPSSSDLRLLVLRVRWWRPEAPPASPPPNVGQKSQGKDSRADLSS